MEQRELSGAGSNAIEGPFFDAGPGPVQDRPPWFELVEEHGSTQFWSSQRLPFEPRGEAAAARNVLRAALAKLKASPDQVLAAEYAGPEAAFFDLENVLFYNVGAASFKGATSRGLVAWRRRTPPGRPPSGASYRHHHRYRLVPRPDRRTEVPTLRFPLPKLTSRLKASEVWWPASRGASHGTPPVAGRYRLDVEVPSAAPYIAAFLKPLLDGIVCALHRPSTIDTKAVTRLARGTGWIEAEIIERLSSPSCPALPARTILGSYRAFVKWDPADELCDQFAVTAEADRADCCVWLSPA